MKKIINIGGVNIGGGIIPVIQTMSNLPCGDIDGIIRQADAALEEGARIFRVAVPDTAAAQSIKELKKRMKMPLVADIHFDYRLGIEAVKNGADKLRINPGNMPRDGLKKLAAEIKSSGIPVRVGVNGGSLDKKYKGLEDKARALALSAADGVRLLEEEGCSDIAVSLKSSNVAETVRAYRMIDKLCDYPLHIGVTEAGPFERGIIKSAAGLGALLLDGIGDTLRVSLTADPIEEVRAAKAILRAVGLDKNFVEVISCPKCGRCNYDTEALVGRVTDRVRNELTPLKIAVMGCAVNGPGEAKECDIGIAFGDGGAAIFKNGEVCQTVSLEDAEAVFFGEIEARLVTAM